MKKNFTNMTNREKIINEDLKFIKNNNFKKKFFHKKKILIIGAEGFIGFYLKKYFIKFFNKLKLRNIYFADLKYNKKKKITKNIFDIKFDITKDKIENIDSNFDIIIHAATIASPYYYRKKPLLTADSNVIGIRKVLEYSKSKKSKVKILYFSTSEIYGDPDKKNIPTSEDYRGNVTCVGPRACYDESKRYAETLCYIFANYYKIPVIVVRPFNNYGPGLKVSDKRLPADLAKSIINKKNIQIFSNGSPTRSFCYIADAISGFLNALSYPKYSVFNIGNDKEEVSVKQISLLYKKIAQSLLGYDTKILFKKNKDKNYLIDNPQRRCPDLTKTKKLLKYKPKIDLINGIKKYILFLYNEKN